MNENEHISEHTLSQFIFNHLNSIRCIYTFTAYNVIIPHSCHCGLIHHAVEGKQSPVISDLIKVCHIGSSSEMKRMCMVPFP